MDHNYLHKPSGYFDTARKSFVDILPINKEAKLLEIGTGSGDTAAYALSQGKCNWCCGIELCEQPANEAKQKIQQVIIGNIENLELDLPNSHFDILLMSEVLEHLADPWSVLRKIRPLMKPNSIVVAGSPNVCNRSVIWNLLQGIWKYEPNGIYDMTHLRWFSPDSYKKMFEDCGYTVDHVGPAFPLRWKAKLLNKLTFQKFQHLLHSQIQLRAHI